MSTVAALNIMASSWAYRRAAAAPSRCLPAQNASGNWIKIVQRVPVRIALDPRELKSHPLRVGLSTTVSVDIRDTSGALIASQVRSEPIPVQASLGNDPQVEARIAHILTANGGGRAAATIAAR